MEKKYLDFSLEEFAQDLGSKKSMPGGGSVAAYALNLANGLASMVANFTSGKKKYAAYQADIERILEECQVFHRESMDMVDRDAEALLPLAAVYKMPSETDEEKVAKHAQMQLCLKRAAGVPLERPGRGQEVGTHHVLVALPRADGDHDPSTLGKGVATTLEAIAKATKPGPKLRLLPGRITVKELLDQPAAAQGLVLGVEESRLGPFMFHPRQESHLFLFGDAKAGKTTFLRSIAQEVVRTHSPKDAQIFVVDYRRSLLDQVPEEYLAAYMTNKDEAEENLGGLAEYLKTRMPNDKVTSKQLRDRSWWTGAEAWVLVDDYDLVALQGRNPVAVLQPLMAQAQDVGLHVMVVRRMGGASRAAFEPVLQAMRDLGTTGILMSGSPDEGAIIGRIKPMKLDAGRAQVISRDAGNFLAQLVWSEPNT
mgnify:CR=1 FL=1